MPAYFSFLCIFKSMHCFRPLLVFFAFVCSLSSRAQTYAQKEVLEKVDKALATVLPHHLLPAVRRVSIPYYQSRQPDSEWHLVTSEKAIPANFLQMRVRYELVLRATVCNDIRNFQTFIDLTLDSNLALIASRYSTPLPSFIRNNEPCPLLPRADIVERLKKLGVFVTVPELSLSYYPSLQAHMYILHQLSQDSSAIRIVRVNAYNGDIVEDTTLHSAH